MASLRLSLALLLFAVAAPARADSPSADSPVLGRTVADKVNLHAIDAVAFAPGGVLLIGDGRGPQDSGAQVIAVATGDTKHRGPWKAKLENLTARLAAPLGADADGIKLIDMAVNPASGVAYFAVLKHDGKQPILMTVDPSGEIGHFSLDNAPHARIALTSGDAARVTAVTDLAWADDRVIVAGRSNESFASKVFSVAAPLNHEAEGAAFSAETYHVSHGRWETKAPMSAVLPFHENGQTWVVGAFSCTPIVKYPLASLQPGAVVKGVSVIELGSGNRPLDMFSYHKDGKTYVLANTFRFHHERKPFGPSPYWTVRFEQSLLGESENVNEQAQRRLAKGDQPATDRIQMVDSYHGVAEMDKLDERHALVLRKTERDFDLEALPLP